MNFAALLDYGPRLVSTTLPFEKQTVRVCSRCHQSKPIELFYKDRGRCKPCLIEENKELRERKKNGNGSRN